mmetsp:Transcript_18593/g.57262  ORF Transcript_18593/g.57262 Transcript_18593/m.57262 type:complete len:468 (-) Transcript_18593:20-1423(-)
MAPVEELPLRDTLPPPPRGMHPAYAVVFCLNYMMGSGYLTLPKAFADAGPWWGVTALCAVALGATAAAECILDCMERAKWIAAARTLPESGGSFCRIPLDRPPSVPRLQREAPRPTQLPDLCALYLGDLGYYGYVVALSSFMFGSLWCYAAIFAAAISERLSWMDEAAGVAVFAVLVLPLSLQDLAEQKKTQAMLAFGRLAMLVAMVVTAMVALFDQGPVAPAAPLPPVAAIAELAPVVAFSVVLHHSVPQIVAPVEARTPYTLNVVFRVAFVGAVAIYALFAVPVALLFGERTAAAANLGWATYHHVPDASDPQNGAKSRLVSYLAQFVVLYPAVNVVGAYPITAITFGDALLALARRCRADRDAVFPRPPARHEVQLARLAACIPPLVGAALSPDISKITGVTGCFGLALCAVVPGVLALAARKMSPGPTVHASALNGPGAAAALVVAGTGVGALAFVGAVAAFV